MIAGVAWLIGAIVIFANAAFKEVLKALGRKDRLLRSLGQVLVWRRYDGISKEPRESGMRSQYLPNE